MTDNLNSTQVKILTWVIYALMALLTVATTYLMIENAHLSDKYVRLERYKADSTRTESTLCRIENKLDKIILRVENK